MQEIEENGVLSENQLGFGKGHSTVTAIQPVIIITKNSRKKWVALVLVDIKNAFNVAK